jgi:uncharacterized protein (DUF427 family)
MIGSEANEACPAHFQIAHPEASFSNHGDQHMIRATWNGALLAEAEETQIVEGNHYFPPESVKHDFLSVTPTKTSCPWKGEATYYTISVAAETNVDAAWSYPDPKPEVTRIRDHIAFWKGVHIDVD